RYPRAEHLHMSDTGSTHSRAAFAFKTLHGHTPSSPAGVLYPVYEEISGATTYSQWADDNNVDGEIGTVLEYDDGYLVTFIGEPDENGRALRNDRATNYVGDARNVGMVKVVSDFSAVSSGARNVVPDELVLSGGPGSVTE